jgi:Rieske 2Fe-2S family protein
VSEVAVKDRAPISQAAVEAALAPFGESVTLPAEAYTTDDVFAFEQERFFTRGWVCAGRVDGLVGTNQARAIQLGNEPILLMRDGEGDLRGFYNTCRHRAHELLPIGDAVDMRVLKCPYHSWTYSLEGALKGAPSLTRSPDFAKEDYPLIEVEAETWQGFLFIDPSGEAGPLAEHLGNLDEVLAPWQLATLRTAARHDYEIAANWKLVVENYHECYHCSSIHPALCKVTPPNSGVDVIPTGLWCGGDMTLMDHAATMSFDGVSHGTTIPGLEEELRRKVMYAGLIPNLLISAHPDYVMTHRLIPLSAGRSRIECEWLFPPEAFDKDGFDPAYAVDFWDVTNREDWAACEAVQRGVVSRGYRPGPLSPWESTLHQFYQMVGSAYLGRPLAAPQVTVSSRD